MLLLRKKTQLLKQKPKQQVQLEQLEQLEHLERLD
jgi:hypothetical protein